MLCKVCKGQKEVLVCGTDVGEPCPDEWAPCEHCDGTGVEPPDLAAYELTKARMIRQQASRDDAPPANSPKTTGLYGYGKGD